MKKILELAKVLEECKVKLFKDGWSYSDANEMVKIAYCDFQASGFTDPQENIDFLKREFNLI